ncbi:MAG TPA: heavy-metal-associated domain-containing protein [Lysobacter sp.]
MIRFHVPDMTCGGCAHSISRAVRSLDPAATVDVDVANRLVTLRTDADAQALAEAIREAGYEPRAA